MTLTNRLDRPRVQGRMLPDPPNGWATEWCSCHGDYMIRRSFRFDWTEDDRLTRATWMRGVGILYGCLALLVLGAIALIKPSSVAPNEAADRQTWGAGLQGERVMAMPACRGQRYESCSNPRTRE